MRNAGELAALGTAVFWASGSNLFAAAGRRLGSATVNRARITLAMTLLGLTLLVTRGSPWPWWATTQQVVLLALSGLVGFVFGDTYYFRALVILGPGRASLLSSLSPIFTVLIGWPVLGEFPRPLALLGMALTLGGVFWVLRVHQAAEHATTEGSFTTGVIAGVLGALGQSGGYVISKLALRTGLDPISATLIRTVAAAIGIWTIAAAEGSALRSLQALRDRTGALFVLAGAVCGPFLGVLLSLTALLYIQAGVASSIIAFYPVLAILLSARFHGEKLTLPLLAGALVAVAGVVVLFIE